MLCQMSKYFGKCFGLSTPAPESSFWLRCPSFIITICFTIKINSICGAGQDNRNLRHKFNSQCHALRMLGLRVAISNSQGPISRVLDVRVLCPRAPVSGSWVSGSRVQEFQSPRASAPRVPGLRVPGAGSQVLILDCSLRKHRC